MASHGQVIEPAKRLLGMTLPGGWEVIEQRRLAASDTGGNFSTGYTVRRTNGPPGFLKAMDYSRAFGQSPDKISIALERITKEINFEREMLSKCSHLDRIVTAISSGTVRLPGGGQSDVVEYLIFELAVCDVRRQMEAVQTLEVAWKLTALHHIATGLHQLHQNGIAHQDLKPSNVLVCQSGIKKIGDLGRSVCKDLSAPHLDLGVAGDRTYAPPELLYGAIPRDWNARRFGCDAYHLGSMSVYFFTGACMTELVLAELDPIMHYAAWGGTYGEVLPYLLDSFNTCVLAVSQQFHPDFRESLTAMTLELCNPDLAMRGHPKNRASKGNQYSLERYVSLFNQLSHQAIVRGSR